MHKKRVKTGTFPKKHVAKTTVFSNITTVVSVIAGAVFLNEALSVASIISTIMIVVGVFGVQKLNVKTQNL